MSTIYLYNGTIPDAWSGAHDPANTWKVVLLSGAVFNATHTTLAAVIAAATGGEVSGNGWPSGGQALTGVARGLSGTNGVKLDAADVSVTASGGAIGPYDGYVVVNTSRTGSPPLVMVKLTTAQTVVDGQPVEIKWGAGGIIRDDPA